MGRVRLPAGLSCTQEAPCTIQWTYMTGNSVDSYPEVFRNCADFKLGTSDDVAPSPTSGPTSAPEGSTTAAPAVTPAPTPTPATTAAPATEAPTTAAPTEAPV